MVKRWPPKYWLHTIDLMVLSILEGVLTYSKYVLFNGLSLSLSLSNQWVSYCQQKIVTKPNKNQSLTNENGSHWGRSLAMRWARADAWNVFDKIFSINSLSSELHLQILSRQPQTSLIAISHVVTSSIKQTFTMDLLNQNPWFKRESGWSNFVGHHAAAVAIFPIE